MPIFIYAMDPNLFGLRSVANLDEEISEWHDNDRLHLSHAMLLAAGVIPVGVRLLRAPVN